ncbi:MAG: hypothetical protein ACHP7N_08450 [Caulobacterales bacterium]
MPVWLQYLVALAALIALAPLVALLAKRYGRAAKGGLGLAMIMLGFGEVMDPPSKHIIEADAEDKKGSPDSGEPPLD